MHSLLRQSRIVATSVLLAAAGTAVTHAAPIEVINEGFETTALGEVPAVWLQFESGDASVGAVDTAAFSGSQSLQLEDGPETAAPENQFHPFSKTPTFNTTDPIRVSAKVLMNTNGSTVGQNAGLDITLEDSSGPPGTIVSRVRITAETDAASHTVRTFIGNDDFADLTVANTDLTGDLGFTLNTGEWFEVVMELSAVSNPLGNPPPTFTVSISQGANSVTLGEGENWYAWDNREASQGVADFSVLGFNFGDDASDATVNIDDVVVTVIPEPASLALLGLGGVSMLMRRRW